MVKPSPNPIITSNSAKSHLWSQIKTKNIRNPRKIFEISKVSTLIRKLSKAQLLTLPELGERSIRKKKRFFFRNSVTTRRGSFNMCRTSLYFSISALSRTVFIFGVQKWGGKGPILGLPAAFGGRFIRELLKLPYKMWGGDLET